MKIKIKIWVVAVVMLVAATGGFVSGRYYSDNKKPNFSEKYILYVYPETTVE